MNWQRQLLLLCLCGLLWACTMPLPVDLPRGSDLAEPGQSSDNPENNGVQGPFHLLDRVSVFGGYYNQLPIHYLDLDTCGNNPSCINRLPSPLSPLLRYEFFFSDGSPVIGQSPVFNTPAANEADSPFRRIIRVIVPTGYRPNTIRSSLDVVASQFRTEATDQVQNNPVLKAETEPSLNLTIGQAWSQNQALRYLDLGAVPYSALNNRIGTGVIYFMRNQDSQDLPSRPRPIFDSVPGELLYSPVRQVFRAVAENQAEVVPEDPSLNIRSQEELLQAVNQGVFRLEDTQEYFNYPMYLQGSVNPLETYALSLTSASHFAPLPRDSFYVLWAVDQLNQARQILQFRAEGGIVRNLSGQILPTRPGAAGIFNFSRAELNSFRFFLVTIEASDVSEPTGSTLLQARYEARADTLLTVPFASSYQNLQQGFYMLAAPTSNDINAQTSGLWFVQRTDQLSQSAPLTRDLFPGLILSLPPRGWVYNGWVLASRRPLTWLPTGRFRAINEPDQSQRFMLADDRAYAFPGEDFLINAPSGVVFPLNLPSTGDVDVVVSLEPENIGLSQPFFQLYRAGVVGGTQALSNQALPFTPVSFPSLNLRLTQNTF